MSHPRSLNAGGAGGPVPPVPDHLVDPHPDRLDPARPDRVSVLAAHRQAVAAGENTYVDPSSGWSVFTARFLWERGTCCDSGCRHCPYVARPGVTGRSDPLPAPPLP
jgi:hypothetical protein